VEHGDGRAEQEGADDHQRVLLQQSQGDTNAYHQQAGDGQSLRSPAPGQPGHANGHDAKAQQRQCGEQTEGAGVDVEGVTDFHYQGAYDHQAATQVGGCQYQGCDGQSGNEGAAAERIVGPGCYCHHGALPTAQFYMLSGLNRGRDEEAIRVPWLIGAGEGNRTPCYPPQLCLYVPQCYSIAETSVFGCSVVAL